MNSQISSRCSLVLTFGLVIALLAGCGTPAPKRAEVKAGTWQKFEARLEYLRQQMKIPGMSAGVVMDQKLVWAKGFGYADLENQIEATPDTPYHLASVTKTVAATLVMQLVQEGLISLDDPVSKYGVELESEGTVLVRHLLTHTSSGLPGTVFRYDGGPYALLSRVAEQATGRSFGTLMKERILEPAGMTNTWMDYQPCAIALGLSPYPADWDATVIGTAKPYQLAPSLKVVQGIYTVRGFSAASGLISTVNDLAKFDIALDQTVLLQEQTKVEMLSAGVPIYPDRTDLTHGLGWFSEEFMGTQLNWHAGQMPPSASANIVKAPEQGLTFIVLANTDYLNVPWAMTDITYQTVALAFYETFVFSRQFGKAVPEVDWEAGEDALVDQLSKVTDPDVRKVLDRELWAYRQLFAGVGRRDLADRLLQVHERAYPGSSPGALDRTVVPGVPAVMSASLATDQVQLSDEQLERLMGGYVLSDAKGNPGSLPHDVRFQAIKGKPVVSFPQGCFDLVSTTPTLFTTPQRDFTLSFQLDGEASERITVRGAGFEAVYLPQK